MFPRISIPKISLVVRTRTVGFQQNDTCVVGSLISKSHIGIATKGIPLCFNTALAIYQVRIHRLDGCAGQALFVSVVEWTAYRRCEGLPSYEG